MGTTALRSMGDFARLLVALEATPVDTLVASTFLGSHLFSKDAILRFFSSDKAEGVNPVGVADLLWHRRGLIHKNMAAVSYSELYELNALEGLVTGGQIHAGHPGYRVTPREAAGCLDTLCLLLSKHPLYHVAFTTKGLPYVFTVKKNRSVTVDVTRNFCEQLVQGLHIVDNDPIDAFTEEYQRIWCSRSTISDQGDVLHLVREKQRALGLGRRM